MEIRETIRLYIINVFQVEMGTIALTNFAFLYFEEYFSSFSSLDSNQKRVMNINNR